MTPSDPALLDTNVLVYAYFQQAPQHAACKALLDQGQQAGAGLCVAPQNLLEFFAIVTNPKRVTSPRTAAQALDMVAEILALPGVRLLPVPADVVDRWISLVRQSPATGAETFDAQLVAVMQGNGVATIHTFDAADFQRFAGIRVLTP